MKTILTIITALLIGSAAYAEIDSHLLSTHGKWEVEVNIDENDYFWCSVDARDRNNSLFSINVDQDGEYEAIIIISDADFMGNDEIDLKIRVGQKLWRLHRTQVMQFEEFGMLTFTFGYDPEQRKFVRDFARGNSMSIHWQNGDIAAMWSLRGSSDAIRALDACRRKIMVSY